VSGTTISAGDKVTVWWPSANRDESVFDDPFRFDIRRAPNPHVTFGHRTHFCLGANLARLEIEIFKEPNPRVADCHVAEGTLYLKGVTLRASDASPEMLHSLNLMVDELARQVKRHRDKLRHRREAHASAARAAMGAASPVILAEVLRPAMPRFLVAFLERVWRQ